MLKTAVDMTSAGDIKKALEWCNETIDHFGQKLDEQVSLNKVLSEQNKWLSEENAELTDRNIHLLQENSALQRSGADLVEAEKASAGDVEALQELKKKCAELEKEKGLVVRKFNLMEEKIATSEELQKKAEFLAGEIQSLAKEKTALAETIKSLAAEKDRLIQKNNPGDLERWIKIAVNLAVIQNGSVKDGKKIAQRIIAKMPDLAQYGEIPDLYEYTEKGSGSRE